MSNDFHGRPPGPTVQPASDSAALAAFEAYWRKMRHGAIVPRRSDIDPRGIEPLLGNAFITERIAPGLARLRIAGGHLTDLMGMEVRGMPISAFLEPGSRDELAHHLVCLFDQPATLRLSLVSAARPGAPKLEGTLLMMPLRSDLGDISRALGCLVSTGTIGRGPRRFEIAQATVTPLDACANPDAKPRLIPFLPERAEDERPPEAVPARRPSERPYLRLVKS
ncbi:PAS domain-containing protein [Roseovarius sp. S4756]|uniref:PAS domain-containing protein n=1 Tax=Roseovarius maritimus TaxID=3342637 RepID=UPI00372B01BC